MSSMAWTIAYERTMFNEQLFFETYIYPKDEAGEMTMPVSRPVIRGTDDTSLLLVKDFDLTDYSP